MPKYLMLRRALPIAALALLLALGLWKLAGQDPLDSGSPGDAGASAESSQIPSGSGNQATTDLEASPIDIVRSALARKHVVRVSAPDYLDRVFGEAHWISLNSTLVAALKRDPLISPSEIRRLGAHQMTSFESSSFEVEFTGSDTIFFWLECPGYRPASCFMEPLQDLPEFALEPCGEFEVETLDPDGSPILGANVVLTREASDDSYIDLDWRGRLERRYFQLSSATDSAGIARFDVLPDARVFVWVAPRRPFGLVTRDQLHPEGRITVQVSSAATIYGRITTDSGDPIAGAFVGVMTMNDFGVRKTVGDATTSEDGHFRNEQVSASGEGVIAIVYAEDYEPRTVPIPFLQPGQEHRIDLSLRAASPRQFRVLSPNGDPLPGLKVEFAHDSFGWIPFASTADDQGMCEVRAVLADDTDYFINVYSVDTRVHQSTVRTQSHDDIVDIVVPNLGRFVGKRPDTLIGGSIEITPQGIGTRSVWFHAASTTPWIPAGPAHLQRIAPDQSLGAIKSIAIQEGDQPWPELLDDFPELRFELELLPKEEVEIRLTGAGSAEQKLGEVDPGSNSFSIPAPGLEVQLLSNLRGRWILGTPCSNGDDCDLGTLAWPESSSIRVVATGPDHVGMPRTAIQLFSKAGAFLSEKKTDALGIWTFDALAPGAYLVRVSPQDGHGAPLPPNLHEVTLRSGQSLELRSRFQSESGIEIIPPARDGIWRAELEASGTTIRRTSDAHGVIRFPTLAENGLLHLWWFSREELCVIRREVSQADRRIEFVAPSPASIQVRSDEAGAVRLIAGTRILGQVPVGPNAQFKLSADAPGGVFLQWIGTSRNGTPIPLEEVLTTRELSLAPQAELAVLHVRNELGEPIPAAQVLLLDHRVAVLGSSDGSISLDSSWMGSRVLIERPGHHPILADAGSGTEYVLRRYSGNLSVQGPTEARFARVIPLFELSVPLKQSAAELDTSASAVFSSLPSGNYRVEWLSESGEALTFREVELEAGRPFALKGD